MNSQVKTFLYKMLLKLTTLARLQDKLDLVSLRGSKLYPTLRRTSKKPATSSPALSRMTVKCKRRRSPILIKIVLAKKMKNKKTKDI